MATFTIRPVKAGLPALGEIEQATLEELQRQQVIAVVAIADDVSVIVKRLQQLTQWASFDELRRHLERE